MTATIQYSRSHYNDVLNLFALTEEQLEESIQILERQKKRTGGSEHLDNAILTHKEVHAEVAFRYVELIKQYNLKTWDWFVLILIAEEEAGTYIVKSQKKRHLHAERLKFLGFVDTVNPQSPYWYSLTQIGIEALNTFKKQSPIHLEAIYRSQYPDKPLQFYYEK